MNTAEKWHGTTIVLLEKTTKLLWQGMDRLIGNTVLKSKAKKVERLKREEL